MNRTINATHNIGPIHHQCGADPVESGQARLASKIDFMRLLGGSH
jgi:hypothetical protein